MNGLRLCICVEATSDCVDETIYLFNFGQDNLITRACYSRVQVRVAWHERAGDHQKNHSE
ncbi:hypothetical protein BDE02_04G093200 [Populus trichocarpa]|nr:hypothetical protein BDE02_04G093200 [Populus trichocarpa]